jgi:integrase
VQKWKCKTVAKKFYANDLRLRSAVDQAIAAGGEHSFPISRGLTCKVTKAGKARFVHRFPFGGGWKTVWLEGAYPRDVSLAAAMLWRDGNNALLDEHQNPQAARESGVVANPTLAEYSRAYFLELAPPAACKAPDPEKTTWLRDMTIRSAGLANMKIDAIKTAHVVEALRPYWNGRTPRPSAHRIREALARVLLHRHTAQGRDLQSWTNPAAFEPLAILLGNDEWHAEEQDSLDFEDVPAFVAELRKRPDMSARLCEWIILTGCRADEGCGARWREIDLGRRAWVIPPERIKTEQNKPKGKPFVVPLSLAMVAVLRRVAENREGYDLGPDDLIFPAMGKHRHANAFRRSGKRPEAYGTDAVLKLVKKINPEVCTHGFRASHVSWGIAIEHRRRGEFDLAVMDRCLGHMIGAATASVGGSAKLSAVVAKYARKGKRKDGGDPYLGRRKVVMREWSAYIEGKPAPARVAPTPPPVSNVATLADAVAARRAA